MLQADELRRPPRGLERARPPALHPQLPGAERTGVAEIVAASFDRDTVPRGVGAFAARSFVFDGEEGAHGAVAGGVRTARDDVRYLYLEVPDEVEWLVFLEHTVGPPGGPFPWPGPKPPGTIVSRPLSVHWLSRSEHAPGPVPAAAGVLRPSGLRWRRPRPPSSALGAPLLLHGEWDVAPSFNAVILGDGFTSTEQAALATLAQRASDALLRWLPFPPPTSPLAERVRILHVPAVSEESGIATCEEEPGSHFGVVRCDDDDPDHDPWMVRHWLRVDDAVSTVADPGDVDLVVMLVNTDLGSGFAKMGGTICFIPDRAERFARRVSHEAAHIVGELCDEYVGCFVRDCDHPRWANVATRRQVNRNELPWDALLLDSERSRDGTPRARQDLGEELTGTVAGMLGAFAGCAYLEGACRHDPQVSECDRDGPLTGAYYRPMRACRMRALEAPGFCRVCETELETRILSRITP